MTEPIQPIVPEGTPLPTPPVGVPPFPITPFAVWTWSTPVIPEFYWNVYSAEQRIKQICKEIGKIESYLNYLANETNKNIIEIHKLIEELTNRVAALEKKVEEEVARLDALIAKLREDLEKEIHDRQDADEALGERIDQEVIDRTHGDDVLHQEISKETQDRIHADDQLHAEISQETQNREDADTALETRLTAAIAQRLLPTDVTAGEEISITRPDPNSNRIVIASTVAHSISELETEISGLQAALTSETAERRADDSKLWAAVNQRIERGKILAGAGIRVENDPDASTVTISATGGGTGGSTEITGTAPITVTDGEAGEKIVGVSAATEDAAGVITEARVKELAPKVQAGTGIKVETEGSATSVSLATPYPTVAGTAPVTVQATSSTTPGAQTGTTYSVGVSAATESEAGIISEARVKELAGTVAPSLSAEAPLKVEDGKISLTKDPAGPVTSSSAGLSVREITPKTESESEAGVVSKGTIKTLASAYAQGVKLAGDVGEWKDPFRLLPEDTPGGAGGSLVLKNNTISDTYDVSSGLESKLEYGKLVWFRDLGSVNNEFTIIWLPKSLAVEVTTDGTTWSDPDENSIYNVSFELVVTYSASYPGYGDLGVRLTERGRYLMEQNHWTGAKFRYTLVQLNFGYPDVSD